MIRLAQTTDAAAVAAIWNHYIRDTTITFALTDKTVADVAALIATRPAFFVATIETTVAGFATYAQFRPGDGYALCMEHTVLLAPDAGGAGLGGALLAAVEAHAASAGAHSMIGVVSAENAPGRAFHARMGYAETAHLRETGRKFGRWLDVVMMQKILS